MAQMVQSADDVLRLADELAADLAFYDEGAAPYTALVEQQAFHRCRESLDKLKDAFHRRESVGSPWQDQLTEHHWERLAELLARLAWPLISTQLKVTPTSKTRHSSAQAVAVLASLSACNADAKVIASTAAESGIVDIFVATLRQELRTPVPGVCVRVCACCAAAAVARGPCLGYEARTGTGMLLCSGRHGWCQPCVAQQARALCRVGVCASGPAPAASHTAAPVCCNSATPHTLGTL